MAAKLCNVCEKRRPYTGKGDDNSAGSGMCNPCATEGGWENSHSDHNHEAIAKGELTLDNTNFTEQAALDAYLAEELDYMKGCWVCHPELNEAKKEPKKGTGPKTQGVRRPQFNHRGHSHPQTPAARRACKNAFWAIVKDGDAAKVAQAQAEWDYHCDGHGKLIPMVKEGKGKAATWHVVPEQETEAATVKATAAAVKKASKKAPKGLTNLLP